MTSGAPRTLTNFLSLCRWTWLTWRGLTSWRRKPTDGSSSTCWRRCWHSTPTNGSRPWRRWTIHSLPWRTCCTSLTAHSKTTRSAVDDQSRYRSMFRLRLRRWSFHLCRWPCFMFFTVWSPVSKTWIYANADAAPSRTARTCLPATTHQVQPPTSLSPSAAS